MASKLLGNNTVQLTDWQIFTNNGNFNNPLPPSRRLKKRYSYFVLEIDADHIRDRCRSTRSRSDEVLVVA
jgi:hypothetical protein